MRQKLVSRKTVALLLAVVMMLGWCGVANANIIDAVNQLHAQGLESSAEVNQAYIDLSNVSSGTITSVVYSGISQTRVDKSFTVASQVYMDAMDRITRFIFELTNRYRPDTDLALSGVDCLPTVHAYTYGTMKDEAIWAVVNGLPDCLGNAPITSVGGGGPWIDKYSPEQITTTIASSTFTISSLTYTTSDGTTKTMDVAPEIKDDRTFIPVRFLAYALGVPEEGILWNGIAQTVTIANEDATIGLKIGSTTEIINGKPQQMDVAPYIKNGRTMLPARWVAEPLGATVDWDEQSQQVKIEVKKQGQ